MAGIFGIVNVTPDSFSDGGQFLDPGAAIRHARSLIEGGATVLDLGPASSNPDADPVDAVEEQRRLEPIVDALASIDVPLSLDSYLPDSQRWALRRGFDYLNDIQGFPDASMYPELADSDARLVVMHSIQRLGVATRDDSHPEQVWAGLIDFFDQRFAALERAGIAAERMILDPGMGYFLGANPESSHYVLTRIAELERRYDREVLISVSRKSLIAALLGDPHRPPLERAAGTLAAELWAVAHGADWIRTHDVRALSDALRVQGGLSADRLSSKSAEG